VSSRAQTIVEIFAPGNNATPVLRCLILMLFIAIGAPLRAETDFFGLPVTPKPATPKRPLPATPPPVVRPPEGVAQTSKPDPIVGEWRWFDDQNVKFFADGRANSEKTGNPTWTVTVGKNLTREYRIRWKDGAFADVLTLSPDGAKLDGTNDTGTHVWATRIAAASSPPAPSATPLPIPALLRLATPVPALKGKFHVSAADSASIYVNGAKVLDVGYKPGRSGEMELKVGDHVVAHMKVEGFGRKFEMLFAASDGTKVVSFRAIDFKIAPGPEIVDFTPAEFSKMARTPKVERRKSDLSIKSYSDNLWGDADECAIACTIASKMISQQPK